MLRHQGKSRTLKNNLRIAVVLSFVAGLVNVTGFLAFKQLTTNVTGHFALFIYDLANFEFWKGTVYFLYIFVFLAGSFTSSFLIETFKENKKLNVFVIPTIIECLILTSIVILNYFSETTNPTLIVCSLLFAMGIQNSFVSKISNAVVRTTHLTGLFTDLGIELSQLFFPESHPHQEKIKANIKLRIYIISFFFLGGLLGGYTYLIVGMKLNTLIIGVLILVLSLFYDGLRYRLIISKRRYKLHSTKNQKHAISNL